MLCGVVHDVRDLDRLFLGLAAVGDGEFHIGIGVVFQIIRQRHIEVYADISVKAEGIAVKLRVEFESFKCDIDTGKSGPVGIEIHIRNIADSLM